jgi:hypothetical protein
MSRQCPSRIAVLPNKRVHTQSMVVFFLRYRERIVCVKHKSSQHTYTSLAYMVLFILSTFFLNTGLICCATYWLMQARTSAALRPLSSPLMLLQDSDHSSGRVETAHYVKSATSIVFVWEKLTYINAVAMYVLVSPLSTYPHPQGRTPSQLPVCCVLPDGAAIGWSFSFTGS